MENLLKYYLNFSLFGMIILMCFGCQDDPIIYKKSYSNEEIQLITDGFFESMEIQRPYQGSVAEQFNIREVEKILPNNATLIRAEGIPYLKRGFASEAYKHYTKAADLDPTSWAGFMAYCWLYFYRDYETALQRIEQLDTLTPNFVDYPQATSIDYMRGICYLKLGDVNQAIYYLSKHIDKETLDIGPEYIEGLHYQILGIAYTLDDQFEKADSIFNLGLTHNRTADLYYYQCLNHLEAKQMIEAKEAYINAKKSFDIGGINTRHYVEEFYAIYNEDLQALEKQFL